MVESLWSFFSWRLFEFPSFRLSSVRSSSPQRPYARRTWSIAAAPIYAALLLAPVVGHTLELKGTFRFGTVPNGSLADVMGREPIVAQAGEGEDLIVHGHTIKALTDAGLVVGTSADFLYVAVVQGTIDVGSIKLDAGRALFWPTGGPWQFAYFDAAVLRDSLSQSLPVNMLTALASLEETQETQKFWGLLTDVGLNLQASTPVGLEVARRAYLSQPAVATIRFSPGTEEEREEAVAAAFVSALRNRDTTTIAALLQPFPFISDADNGVSPAVIGRRYDAAQALLDLLDSRVEIRDPVNSDNGTWQVPEVLSFAIKVGDRFPFVDASTVQFEGSTR